MNAEKKTIISILRSLTISSPQKGISIRDLTRDFYEQEGARIPKFEYRSLEEFLRASGEFIIENFRGELIIYEKPNSDSWHISKLVAEQGRPKKRIPVASRFRRSVRQPQPQPRSAYPLNNTRSPSKTNFSNRYNNINNTQRSSQGIPSQQRKASSVEYSFDQFMSQQTDNSYGQNRIANDASNQFRSSINNEPNQANQFRSASNNEPNRQNPSARSIQPSQANDLRDVINEKRGLPVTAYIDLTADDSNSTRITRNNLTSYQHNNEVAKNSPPITPKTAEHYISPQQQKDTKPITTPASAPIYNSNAQAPILANNPFFDVSQPPPNQQPSRMQDRLKNPPVYSLPNKTIGVNNAKGSVNDRLAHARQTLPVIDLTKDTKKSEFNVSTHFIEF